MVDVRDNANVEAMMQIMLGGFAAEMIFDPTTDGWTCSEDIWRARRPGEAAGLGQADFVATVKKTIVLLRSAHVRVTVLVVAGKLEARRTIKGRHFDGPCSGSWGFAVAGSSEGTPAHWPALLTTGHSTSLTGTSSGHSMAAEWTRRR